MRNRCILCLLICGALLYYALPHLSLHGYTMATYFSWLWLSFLTMAIAGNLAAILYTPKKKAKTLMMRPTASKKKVRVYDN